MHVHIDTTDGVARERVIQLLDYALNGQREVIDSLQLSIETIRNPLGIKLHHCRLNALLRQGSPIGVEEVQSSLDLALTRALDRCVRTIERRRRVTARRHSA